MSVTQLVPAPSLPERLSAIEARLDVIAADLAECLVLVRELREDTP